jgi:two-component system, response regulator YesN
MPTILIVDDSAEVRDVVRTFLDRASEKTGFTVCGEASDGLQAIKQAEILRPDFVLIDLKMPALNGIEAASVIKRMLPRTQVILFSNYTEQIGTTLATSVGIDLVMAKGSLSDMARGLTTLNDRASE